MEKKRTAHAPNVDSTKENLRDNYNTSNTAQRARILEWLRRESLTTLQAHEHLDIMHPAARVQELRKQHNIITHWTTDDSGKAKHRVARYVLLIGVANE